jgi:hypothetical protein
MPQKFVVFNGFSNMHYYLYTCVNVCLGGLHLKNVNIRKNDVTHHAQNALCSDIYKNKYEYLRSDGKGSRCGLWVMILSSLVGEYQCFLQMEVIFL